MDLNCRLRAAASRRKKDWEEQVVIKAREMGGEAFVVAKMDVEEKSHLTIYSGRTVVGATGNKSVQFLKLPSQALPITQVFNYTLRLFPQTGFEKYLKKKCVNVFLGIYWGET